jgi:hypothetical protein
VPFWDEEFAWTAGSGEIAADGRRVAVEDDAAEEFARIGRRIAARRAELRRQRARRRARARLLLLIAAVAGAGAAPALVLRGGGIGGQEHRGDAAGAGAGAAGAAGRAVFRGPPLRLGDRGESVRGLQAALALLGFDPGPQDGLFQGRTRAAVSAFQRAHGVPPDGVAGAATAEALSRALGVHARPDGSRVRQGLAASVRAGRLPGPEAARDGALVGEALARIGVLSPGGAAVLTSVLHDVAASAPAYDRPRAVALFATLRTNERYLRTRPPPAGGVSVDGADGVRYRAYPSHGLAFQPLASFAALNADVTQGRGDDARRLASALLARAVPAGDALVWEYYFPFGGPARWGSGFVQAVAADALARASGMLHDARLATAAQKAFRAVPGRYVRPLAGGLWIREYGWSDIAILNAQLQTMLSLSDYARLSGDEEARRVADGLEAATRALLPRFDRGCWSLYSLGGAPASPHYEAYHVRLLEQLTARTGDPLWAAVARRWALGLRGASPGPATCASK